MGYVRRIKQIYGNPNLKDKVLFKYDPAGQRAVRFGCKCIPLKFTVEFTIPGTYTYVLPSSKAWNISYEILGGGGGGGGGGINIVFPGFTLYGSAGYHGSDSSLVSSTYQTTSNTLTIVVGDGGSGGLVSYGGQYGEISSLSDGIGNTFSSTTAIGGIPGLNAFSSIYSISVPVSGLPGTGGRGGNSNSAGSKGVAGYVKFTATQVL